MLVKALSPQCNKPTIRISKLHTGNRIISNQDIYEIIKKIGRGKYSDVFLGM